MSWTIFLTIFKYIWYYFILSYNLLLLYSLPFAEGEVKINIDKLSWSSSLSAPLVRDRLYTGTKSSIIQDVVQLGRLKETYASLSVEAKQHAGACKSDVSFHFNLEMQCIVRHR